MKKITDPSFEYVSAFDTDIRKTFERARAHVWVEQRCARCGEHVTTAAVCTGAYYNVRKPTHKTTA